MYSQVSCDEQAAHSHQQDGRITHVFWCRHNRYAMLNQEWIYFGYFCTGWLFAGRYSCNFVIQRIENMERGGTSAYFLSLASPYENRSKTDHLLAAIPFFSYLCCSQSLCWSGKSEVIGFWIKESKDEDGNRRWIISLSPGQQGGCRHQGILANECSLSISPTNNQWNHFRCFY